MNVQRLFAISLISSLTLATAAVDAQEKELQPRLVTLVNEAMPLSEALKSLQEQTGNTIGDGRKNQRDDPDLKLDLRNVTFWQALDQITARARCGYSMYQDDGRLVLVDKQVRKLNVDYAGICRLAVKQVKVIRDDENGSHYCSILTELAWEPRFYPFYLDITSAEVLFAPANGEQQNSKPIKVVGPGQFRLDERSAVDFELRVPAPPRACPSIESITCQLKLIGPSKMLTFRLNDLKPVKEGVEFNQEEVKVVFKPLPQRKDLWSFDVFIFNPPGSYRFESYQERDWLLHNQISLEKTEKGRIFKIKHQPDGEGAVPEDRIPFSFKRAPIRYDFTNNLPANIAGWELVYRTPGKVVDLPLSFSLKNIILP